MRSLQTSPLVFRDLWRGAAHQLGIKPGLQQLDSYKPVGQARIGENADGAAADRTAPARHNVLLGAVGFAVALVGRENVNSVTRIHRALRPIPSDA